MSFPILLSLTAQLMPVYQQNVPQHYYLLDTLVHTYIRLLRLPLQGFSVTMS